MEALTVVVDNLYVFRRINFHFVLNCTLTLISSMLLPLVRSISFPFSLIFVHENLKFKQTGL